MSDAAIAAGVSASRTSVLRGRALMVVLTAIALVVLPLLPGFESDFARSLLTQMAIAAVFALSFNLLFGNTGLLSFGHAVYFGLGAYAAIHCMRAINHGLPLPIVLVPLAGAIGGLLSGIVFGALTTRRAGTIFALISLGVGELVYAAAFILPGLFGGEEGISASRTKAVIDLGFPLASQLHVYYVVIAWAIIAAMLLHAFIRTPVGRMCHAVRDNPERAEFVGYSAQRVRFISFAVAGLVAGIAGGLHAINYEIVAADAVGAQRSGTVLIMTYIGGIGHFSGPVLGAIVITWLQSSLSAYTAAWQLYLGLFFMLMIVYAPAGLSGLLLRHRRIAHGGALARVLGSYVVAAVPIVIAMAGAVLLIEMSYRLATQPELGTRMRLLGMSLDAASTWPWVLAVCSLAGGLALLRMTLPLVRVAWQRALQAP
ncbi:MAG TPA: branched-chain amino acid ABC transporter permease [Casimicrobiaceae bacterium]|nr:branched-chain amino acid ABC transporter permease [Casimicrobiaceae bacterium]